MQIPLKYKIGQKIRGHERVYIIIGFEYVPDRSIRYILMHQKDGAPEWIYMYEFEILAVSSS